MAVGAGIEPASYSLTAKRITLMLSHNIAPGDGLEPTIHALTVRWLTNLPILEWPPLSGSTA